MLKTNTGRSYIPGKALSENIRRSIIDTIVQNGGDHISGFFGDKYYDVARKFCKQTVCKERRSVEKIVDSREIGPRVKKGAQNPPKLRRTELEWDGGWINTARKLLIYQNTLQNLIYRFSSTK